MENYLTECFVTLLNNSVNITHAFLDYIKQPKVKSDYKKIEPQVKLGACTPDILFSNDKKPILYIESKLDAPINPLQLFRAKSWMMNKVNLKNRVILISRSLNDKPNLSWKTPTCPVPNFTWEDIINYIKNHGLKNSIDKINFNLFNKKIKGIFLKKIIISKNNSLPQSGYDYSIIFKNIVRYYKFKNSEYYFNYTSNIDPVLYFGKSEWNNLFLTKNCERIHLFYGSRDKGSRDENFRAQIILWHEHDFACSEQVRKYWPLFRDLINTNPKMQFEYGKRQDNNSKMKNRNRYFPSKAPSECPDAMVGLINFNPRVYMGDILYLDNESTTKLVIDTICDPLIRYINSLLIALRPPRLSQTYVKK